MKNISIRGAKTHNLKNINVVLPRDKLIVITGLSGSGKSSLAFDTLYAEGQRRYVESLSSYARQFLSVMEKPDVEHIEGLSPAIAIEQKSTLHNPRSTVGTVTEIYDYLRLLFARVGEPKCPTHNITLEAQAISQMVDQILTFPKESKIMLIAPIVQNRKGEHIQQLEQIRNQGFIRARINGVITELDSLPKLNPNKKHSIEVIVDRLKINSANQSRLADSIATALNISDGIAKVTMVEHKNKEILFSAKFSCPECGYSLTELEPRIFSFNNPVGACPDCDGLGVKQFMDPNKIIFDRTLNLANGAIRGWDSNNIYYHSMLCSLAKHYNFDINTPFYKLKKEIKNLILYGNNGEIITFTYQHHKQSEVSKRKHSFEGIINNMERRYKDTDSQYIREELSKFLSQQTCPECKGTRLTTSARNVFINNTNLPTITNMSIKDAFNFLKNVKLTGWKEEIANKILKEIRTRLNFLINVGLEYLTLSRNADTLSGGEAQRIRLASQIGAGLVGVMYVLDEPSIGLHQRDNAKLIKTLTHLRDLGNTVIVVEHDEEAILHADHVLDIGPGAGVHGGNIVAQGTHIQIKKNNKSLTGKYISGKEKIIIPKNRLKFNKEKTIKLIGAKENNLKNINAEFPIGLLCCVTGGFWLW